MFDSLLYIFVTSLKLLSQIVTCQKNPVFSAFVCLFVCLKDGVDMSPDQCQQNRGDTLKYSDLNTEALIYNKTDG